VFTDSDSFIEHLSTVVQDTGDNYLASRYVGFIAVASITIYEITVKKLLKDFAKDRDPMLGNFAAITFDRINAQIKRDDIVRYLKYFGDDYANRFKELVNQKEDELAREGSLKASYANLLTWRHEFVHAGNLPNQATFEEAVKSYKLGKEVVIALAEVLQQIADDSAERRQLDGES